LEVTLRLADEVEQRYKSNIAFAEMMEPLLEDLRCLRPQDAPAYSQASQTKFADFMISALKTVKETASVRKPLRWRPALKTSLDTVAPRFDINYTFKKDRDSDKDRAKLKQLSRQLKRETKSTTREIRRDADFIDQERYKAESDRRQKLRDERGKNFAWMEDEQATLKQQVRMDKKGLGMKGGGSGVIKKARVVK
jgi:hypothetical protein